MGMFDSIFIENKEYQTKAFGKALRDSTLGDKVTLKRAPVTEADYAESMVSKTVENAPQNYQVQCYGPDGYEWLQIEGSKIISVSKTINPKLHTFDYYGRRYDANDPYTPGSK